MFKSYVMDNKHVPARPFLECINIENYVKFIIFRDSSKQRCYCKDLLMKKCNLSVAYLIYPS